MLEKKTFKKDENNYTAFSRGLMNKIYALRRLILNEYESSFFEISSIFTLSYVFEICCRDVPQYFAKS